MIRSSLSPAPTKAKKGPSNVHKKHKKPTQSVPEGSIVDIYAPFDASNVMVIDPKTKKPTRVYHKVVKGKKVRVAKSGEVLD